MKTTLSRSLSVSTLALLALAPIACVGPVDEMDDVDGTTADNFMSYEEFKAQTYKEPWEGGVWIIDGDMPIATEEQLRAVYDEMSQPGALTAYALNNQAVKWSATDKLSIKYCVSTTFNANYGNVVAAMDSAASAWEAVANVNFIHMKAEDGNCTAANANVVFDVNPVENQTYSARAFFPNYPRASRNVLIDSWSFGNIGSWSLAGILRHELGHALGFRHEHIRPEANPTGDCVESANWSAITDYDSASIMHYRSCNGTQTGDLILTDKDKAGAKLHYGAPVERVAVLEDRDADYSTAPFDDNLSIFDFTSGTRTDKLYASGFNLSQHIGSWRSVSLSPKSDLVAATEDAADRLTLRKADGTVVFTKTGDFGAVAVTSTSVLALRGSTTSGTALDRFTHSGTSDGTSTALRGIDLVVDEPHNRVWTVGADVRTGSLDTLSLIGTPYSFGWTGVSIDVADDGSAFVAERAYSSTQGQDRIVRFSPSLAVLKSTPISGAPFCVRVDRGTGEVWVAHSNGLTVLKRDGSLLRNITGVGAMWSVSPRGDGGNAWAVGAYNNAAGGLWDNQGTKLISLPSLSTGQKYIASDIVQ